MDISDPMHLPDIMSISDALPMPAPQRHDADDLLKTESGQDVRAHTGTDFERVGTDFESETDFYESVNEVFPTVSYDMLVDFLERYLILYNPAHSQHTFKWFLPVSRHDLDESLLDNPEMLYVCHTSTARMILDAHPYAFVLALNEGTDIPVWVTSYRKRVILIQSTDTFSYFIFLIQKYFMSILIWENELDRIVLCDGSPRDLLLSSEGSLRNFIVITDEDSNLIACTANIAAPSVLFERLIEMGCYDSDEIDRRRRVGSFHTHDGRHDPFIEDPTEAVPYPVVHIPFAITGCADMCLTMVCSRRNPTPGLIDKLQILLERVRTLCEGYWRKRIRIDTPHHALFTKLIDGEEISDTYLATQLELAGIPTPCQLKLLVFSMGSNVLADKTTIIAQAAGQLNHGSSYCFTHDEDLVILCYAAPGDSEISTRKTAEDLERLVFGPYHLSAGSSQIFEDIRDLDLAYRQARLTLHLKPVVDRELYPVTGHKDRAVYPFEDVLLYYLIERTDTDHRFLRFSLSHTLLEKISAEDLRNGTDELTLLWSYLYFERNASTVARHLHMHRNTVLYHIEKIEKRFDFDLSEKSMRDRMLIDFKVFYLTRGHGFDDGFSMLSR